MHVRLNLFAMIVCVFPENCDRRHKTFVESEHEGLYFVALKLGLFFGVLIY